MNRRSPRFRGFTLVEILVVVAVLSILAALGYSVFGRVREAGRRTHCTSNLANIGRALSMYAADHDDVLPLAADPLIHYNDCSNWCIPMLTGVAEKLPLLPEPLQPYIRSHEVWHCPSDKGDVVVEFPYHHYNSAYTKYGMSYAYQILPALFHKRVADLEAPTSIVWDFGYKWHGGQQVEQWRINVLFEDGHVKMQNREQLAASGIGV